MIFLMINQRTGTIIRTRTLTNPFLVPTISDSDESELDELEWENESKEQQDSESDDNDDQVSI